jgi:hypothetical protein
MNTLTGKLSNDNILISKIETLWDKYGWKFFETLKPYNLNIIGIRNATEDPNRFDDSMVVIYSDATGKQQIKVYDITTHPGLAYLLKPVNPDGTGILAVPQRCFFEFGVHSSHLLNGTIDTYKCLTQKGPIRLIRDNVRDGKLYFDGAVQTGMFAVQIHRALKDVTTTTLWNWSAACQVFSSGTDFDEFMGLCEKSAAIYGNSFTYSIINENDLV